VGAVGSWSIAVFICIVVSRLVSPFSSVGTEAVMAFVRLLSRFVAGAVEFTMAAADKENRILVSS